MITLKPAERTLDQLRALAASGSSGMARKAQAELRDRINRSLADSLGSERG